MKKKTADTSEGEFARQFAVITSRPPAKSGPWEYDQPLKSKPKSFNEHDPDLMGG